MVSGYIEGLIRKGWEQLNTLEYQELSEWLAEAIENDYEKYIELSPKPEVKPRRRGPSILVEGEPLTDVEVDVENDGDD